MIGDLGRLCARRRTENNEISPSIVFALRWPYAERELARKLSAPHIPCIRSHLFELLFALCLFAVLFGRQSGPPSLFHRTDDSPIESEAHSINEIGQITSIMFNPFVFLRFRRT